MSDDFERRMQSLHFAKAMYGEGSWPSLQDVFETAESIFEFANKKPVPTVTPTKLVFPVDTNRTPIKPYDYQLDIVRAVCTQKRLVINKARQMGVTTALIAACAKLLKENADYNILFTTPRFENGLRVIEQLRPLLAGHLIETENKGILTLSNGSRFMARATTRDATRGLTLHLIVIDEATDRLKEAMESFQPSLATGARIVIASTPMCGAFMKLVGDRSWQQMLLPHFLHPNHNENFETVMKNQLGEATYRREFCCEFVQNVD